MIDSPHPKALERLDWSRLNHLQVGRYAEYLTKMEFALYGFQVYSSEVDDHGVDFVARYGQGPFLEVQVKSVRSLSYVFAAKSKFPISPTLYLALVLFAAGAQPSLFLIPSQRWQVPDALFVDRNYPGLPSPPEYGLNLSKKNLSLLEPFVFETTVARLMPAG